MTDLNLSIHKGERVALIGSNGAGKSTMMKMMVGLLRPNSGCVSLYGEAIGEKKAEDLSRQISLVYQNPEEMFIKDSIRADISYAMEVRGVRNWQQRTDELLARFRLSDLDGPGRQAAFRRADAPGKSRHRHRLKSRGAAAG